MDHEEINSRLAKLHEALRFAIGCGCCASPSRLREYFKDDPDLTPPSLNNRRHLIKAGLDEIFSLGREYQKGIEVRNKKIERVLEQAMHHFIETPPRELKDEE